MLTKQQMIRAFARVWHDISVRIDEAERADYQFDYGEFSGSYFGDCYQEEYDACIARCAARFGVSPKTLDDFVTEDDYRYQEEFYRAIARKAQQVA